MSSVLRAKARILFVESQWSTAASTANGSLALSTSSLRITPTSPSFGNVLVFPEWESAQKMGPSNLSWGGYNSGTIRILVKFGDFKGEIRRHVMIVITKKRRN